jgi:hypothetical protein
MGLDAIDITVKVTAIAGCAQVFVTDFYVFGVSSSSVKGRPLTGHEN